MRAICVIVVCSVAVFAAAQSVNRLQAQRGEAPKLGIHWARGHLRTSTSNSAMSYHNGPVLLTTTAGAIFWGSSWPDPYGKVTGMDAFFQGLVPTVGGSGTTYNLYANTTNEYYNSSNNLITSQISYVGFNIDNAQAPRRAPSTSTVLSEVCKVEGAGVVPNALYVVYSDQPRKVSYCGWHSWGACSVSGKSIPIQFAFLFNLDNDAGCDPGDTTTGYYEGLSAIANVTAHEFSETRTDPNGNAWYDKSGSEDGDKCAWAFDPVNPTIPFNNGWAWHLQGEWSNAAYNSNSGFANLNGQLGCIDGDNP